MAASPSSTDTSSPPWFATTTSGTPVGIEVAGGDRAGQVAGGGGAIVVSAMTRRGRDTAK